MDAMHTENIFGEDTGEPDIVDQQLGAPRPQQNVPNTYEDIDRRLEVVENKLRQLLSGSGMKKQRELPLRITRFRNVEYVLGQWHALANEWYDLNGEELVMDPTLEHDIQVWEST
jgi:hypothetical protein